MNSKAYLAAGIFSIVLTLSACQTTPNIAADNSIKTPMPTLSVNLDSDGDGVPDSIDRCPNTPKNAVTDDYGCEVAISIGRGLKMEYRAFFDKDSSELLPKYQAELNNIGKRMQEHKTAVIRIEGHNSRTEVDSAALNQANPLAQARADNVKNYLTSKFNIAPERITVVEYGANRPTAPSDSEEGNRMNRRVYAIVFKPEEQESHWYKSDSGHKIIIKKGLYHDIKNLSSSRYF